jgi:hypothetical protein
LNLLFRTLCPHILAFIFLPMSSPQIVPHAASETRPTHGPA